MLPTLRLIAVPHPIQPPTFIPQLELALPLITKRRKTRGEDNLRPEEDEVQHKASTSPYSGSTTTEEQTCHESTDASDSLQDLTNHIQGRSDYPIASGGFWDIWKCELVKPNEIVEVGPSSW
ncbi:hypothetical protein AZE42_12249 [Rhizopogon vesiculosus]|uniref:Uncharacterized protein n=1 Tax=Rhizopogon vesiculosus TaxID=180088 RepID=A0A1J8Q3W8_9AGAM|nr:hypothetical protein AZE42_12249 [Rhizopogon vesiculosus]